jgi:hypothetical protein
MLATLNRTLLGCVESFFVIIIHFLGFFFDVWINDVMIFFVCYSFNFLRSI